MKMRAPLDVSVIVPAYKDSQTITEVISDINALFRKRIIKGNIFVTNDASPDTLKTTLSELKERVKNLHVQTHKINKGYGQTMKELYAKGNQTWLFSLPGDRQVRADVIIDLLPYTKDADMIIGYREHRVDNPKRKFQSKLYNVIIQMLFRYPIRDANSVRLMKRSIVKKVDLTSTSAFIDAELGIRARDLNFKVIEVPIKHYSRISGSGSGGSLKVILPTIKDMILFFISYRLKKK